MNKKKEKAQLIDPAVKGTLNVLRSCAKVTSVKRVVVTSSMVSVLMNSKPLKHDVVVDETWFSDAEFCVCQALHLDNNGLKTLPATLLKMCIQLSTLDLHGTEITMDLFRQDVYYIRAWYPLSKTLAEEAAWKFGKENGIDLVMIQPGFVLGPCLQPTLNFTSEKILNLVKSGTLMQQICFFMQYPKKLNNGHLLGINMNVDIRDVACAHMKAFEIPSASGRYCLVGTSTYSAEALKILRKLYPAPNLPEKCEEENFVSPPTRCPMKGQKVWELISFLLR
ncbi:hypothetical protein RJ640_006549 [Escallonia rubra]|uniref:Thioester reductase (TE) domain-containing protein n=1 Tax=Escallonia rubra TaxID=112253 RepID=A0AA88QZ98_9ASTE|nr:hypothetical protein RJ640_006549 [Escallonia rubra]